MPQQLSLYASIADADLKITLHTLVALTGMEPRPIFEHNLIWAPKHPFRPVLAAGQVNQIEQYRIRMAVDLVSYAKKALGGSPSVAATAVGSAEGSDTEGKTIKFEQVPDLILPYSTTHTNTSGANSGNERSEKAEKLAARDWILHVAELPDAGKRKTISQALLSTQVVTGDTFALAANLGYAWAHEYWVKGYQFIEGKVVIELFRLCEAVDPDHDEPGAGGKGNAPTLGLRLLDPSGRWTIKAYTNVQAVTDIEAVTVGTQALEKLKMEVAGLFELDQPDRNCFDTRIKKR